jgi:hypothetical protein
MKKFIIENQQGLYKIGIFSILTILWIYLDRTIFVCCVAGSIINFFLKYNYINNTSFATKLVYEYFNIPIKFNVTTSLIAGALLGATIGVAITGHSVLVNPLALLATIAMCIDIIM